MPLIPPNLLNDIKKAQKDSIKALKPPDLKKDIKTMLKNMRKGRSQAQIDEIFARDMTIAIDNYLKAAHVEAMFAKGMTKAIDTYIKSGIVTTVVAPGIPTAGSPTAQVTTGPGAGTGVIT